MSTLKVELIFKSKEAPESDPSLATEVIAEDEVQALSVAKTKLRELHPDFNFMKLWCWHIEKLGAEA